MQHAVAHGGRTVPPLFKKGIASSPYYPPQYAYDASVPTVLLDFLRGYIASTELTSSSRLFMKMLPN